MFNTDHDFFLFFFLLLSVFQLPQTPVKNTSFSRLQLISPLIFNRLRLDYKSVHIKRNIYTLANFAFRFCLLSEDSFGYKVCVFQLHSSTSLSNLMILFSITRFGSNQLHSNQVLWFSLCR